jgi:hypothetical protein
MDATSTKPDTRAPWQVPLHEYARRPEALRVPRGSILSFGPESITAEWLRKWAKHDLEALAKVLAVPTSGTVDELIGRILHFHAMRRHLATETRESLRGRPGKELRALLKSIGAYAPSNKFGMAGALIGWRDGCRLKGRAALAEANHYLHVLRAVRRGDDVPPEVLQKYPNLWERPGDMPLFEQG